MGERPAPGPFPDLVMSVLREQGKMKERAFAMDLDDLHSLLRAFHRRGIYFASVQGTLRGGGDVLAEWSDYDSDNSDGNSDDEYAASPFNLKTSARPNLKDLRRPLASERPGQGLRAPRPGAARAEFR